MMMEEMDDPEMLGSAEAFVLAAGSYIDTLSFLFHAANREARGEWSSGADRRFARFAAKVLLNAVESLEAKSAEGLEKTALMMAVPWLGRGMRPNPDTYDVYFPDGQMQELQHHELFGEMGGLQGRDWDLFKKVAYRPTGSGRPLRWAATDRDVPVSTSRKRGWG
jgi:hypothetical protein